ncbi:unnamed protein product [Schistocephalus solidus]|uniref:Pecanex-like protein n=1 Tax=Schistocephalus solidus TaxID=70667 RepID=A0A183S7N7_SCHSO|nr:unnamed protein product [Schistocephalus solidus]
MAQALSEGFSELLFNNRGKKSLRLSSFVSSASLVLSWPFPLVILCFHTNRYVPLDPLMYGSLYMAFLLSGFFKRLFLQRFVPPSLFNALLPAGLCLISNSIFLTAIYNGDWTWSSNLLLVLSRLCYGWSVYSGADFTRRAKGEAKRRENVPLTLEEKVSNIAPDLQDNAFHAGVLLALIICLIFEACLRQFGAQMAEFYSMLILLVFSTVMSSVSVPCMFSTIRNIVCPVREPIVEEVQGDGAGGHLSQSTEICPTPEVRSLAFRERLLVPTLLYAVRSRLYPTGQLILTLFSGLLTAATIIADYLLLPLTLVYLRVEFISARLFPFGEIFLLYALLFGTESLANFVVLRYTRWSVRLTPLSVNALSAALLVVALLCCLCPSFVFLVIVSINVSSSLFIFSFCLFCLVSGLLKSAHTVLSGVLFAKYHDACPYLAVVQTSEQLVGLVRSLLSALLIIIAAIVLYTQGFFALMLTVVTIYYVALAVGIMAIIINFYKERTLRISVELAD